TAGLRKTGDRVCTGITEPGHHVIPLFRHEQLVGVLVLFFDDDHAESQEERDFIRSIANVLGGIIHHQRAEGDLHKLMEDLNTARLFEHRLTILVQELNAARLRLEEASRARSEFLAGVSHEVRTPMNVILGMTDLVRRTRLDDQQRRYLDMVSSSADNLLEIINDVLDLSKIEAGSLSLEQIDFDLHETVEDAVNSLAGPAHEKGLEMILFIDPLVPRSVAGDPARLRQILINLIGNAVKFTRQGEVLIRLELETDASSPQFHFSIIDTGVGIPRDRKERLFDSLTRTDGSTTRYYSSSGLGVTVSRQLIELMNGRIWVVSPTNDSEVGGFGTTFHFTLTFAEGSHTSPGISDTTLQVPSMRMLIADDNASNRRLLTALAENWDLRHTVVSSGAEALRMLTEAAEQDRAYTLVLIDHLMPGLDGLEVIGRMRSDPRFKSTPVFLMSPVVPALDRELVERLCISAVLSKPVSGSTLYNTIANSLHSQDSDLSQHLPEVVPTGDSCIQRAAGKKVLLVDDSPMNLILMDTLLKREGFETTTATNGQEAVTLAKSDHFDLIMVDLQMPAMNGLEVTASIREFQKTTDRHTPIIAITANSDQRERDLCLAAGMNDYVSKPINPDKLRSCITRHLHDEESAKQGGNR
ncbi:MAG: response regulator, partial [Planctomycetota bacterium]